MYYTQDTNDYDFNSYSFEEMMSKLSHFLKTQREHIVNLENEVNSLRSELYSKDMQIKMLEDKMEALDKYLKAANKYKQLEKDFEDADTH